MFQIGKDQNNNMNTSLNGVGRIGQTPRNGDCVGNCIPTETHPLVNLGDVERRSWCVSARTASFGIFEKNVLIYVVNFSIAFLKSLIGSLKV